MERKETGVFDKIAGFALALALICTVLIVAASQEVRAEDKSFQGNGSTVEISDEEAVNCGGTVWIQFQSKSDGYLKLKIANHSVRYSTVAGSVQLCNAKKKPLSTVRWYNTSSTDKFYLSQYYGVKKGKTYFLAVYPCDSNKSYAGVSLTAQVKKISNVSGGKKEKAKTIKKNKSVEGFIAGGSKNSQWYQYTVSSSQKLSVQITSYLTDSIKLTLSGAGIKASTFTVDAVDDWGEMVPFTSDEKVRTGTYYVQIQPATKKCSGYYKLKWK